MIRTALVILLCSSVSSYALSVPETGKADSHIRLQAYDPMNRTMLVLTVNRVSNIAFNQMEMIKRIIFSHENGPVTTLSAKCEKGDTSCAGDAPLINNLPLFGKAVGKTDLIVITTSPDGHEHTYQFFVEVRAEPPGGADDPDATYGLQFTYAQQEKAAAAVVAKVTWQEKRDEAVKRVTEARLNTDVFYGPQNWRYMAQGLSKDIAPIEAHDNGRITSLRYPGNMHTPSIFIVTNGSQQVASVCTTGKASKDDSLGTEQVPQVTQMDDLVIIQQTAPHMRLRSGDAVVEIYNCGWDAIGQNPGTGTSSPEVIRRVVSTK
jgi:type IV secretion system protein VirB9